MIAGVRSTPPASSLQPPVSICRVLRLGGTGEDAEAAIIGKRCAEVAGFNVHANVRVGANDRDGLEYLCRYLARPPIANDRLQELPDGRLALRFKQAWRDGTTHIVFTPHELIEKLIPLIPRPRCHLVRYHGILGPAAKDRAKVVPTPPAPPAPDAASADSAGANKAGTGESREIDITKLPRVSRLPWAILLKRVFVHPINCRSRRGCSGSRSGNASVPSEAWTSYRLRRSSEQLG